MFGISTYSDTENFFTKLISQKSPDGTPMFRQIEYSTICPKCVEKGVREVCKHRRGELPHWHDSEEYAQLFQMMKKNSDIAMREIGGISADSSIQPFFSVSSTADLSSGVSADGQVVYVKDLENARADTIFISVDPCGEGSHSEYGIISCIFHSGELVVRTRFFFFYIYIYIVVSMAEDTTPWSLSSTARFPDFWLYTTRRAQTHERLHE